MTFKHLPTKALTLLLTLAPISGLAEPWQVVLTEKQNKAFTEFKEKPTPSAFAIAERGAWARASNYVSLDAAKRRALENCRKHLKKNDLDCVVVGENGKFIAPDTVDLKRASERYRALNGKKATQFFGVVGISFQGNLENALAQFEHARSDPGAWQGIPKDRALERALTNVGLVIFTPTGPGYFFGEQKAYHYASPRPGKVRPSSFDHWAVTKEGLLCMFDGTFGASGKPRGTTCIIIEAIKNGEARYYFPTARHNYSATKSTRRAFIVAGNPGLNSIK